MTLTLQEQIGRELRVYLGRDWKSSHYLVLLARKKQIERLADGEETPEDLWDILDILDQLGIITGREFEETRTRLRRLDMEIVGEAS